MQTFGPHFHYICAINTGQSFRSFQLGNELQKHLELLITVLFLMPRHQRSRVNCCCHHLVKITGTKGLM